MEEYFVGGRAGQGKGMLIALILRVLRFIIGKRYLNNLE